MHVITWGLIFLCRLLETLEAHVERYGLDPLPSHFRKKFPESITLGQTAATWKHIVIYQCQINH